MVLINNLTIDEINAALLHLQRSRSEIVGGTKGNTVNNITVNSSGNGGGYDVDYSSLIKQITDRLSSVETKTSENESNINQQANVNANQQSLIEEIEETLNNLTQSGITQLYFDEQTRTLTIYTTEGQYNTEIPSEEVTMSLANNVLTFTMGDQTVTVNMPYIPASEKGAAGGVATLDSSGRLPYSQLPESAMEFKGTWNASTNDPHLEDGTGTNGDFYVCTMPGTTTFGPGNTVSFVQNDRVIYDGATSKWVKLLAGQVSSVNNLSGDVVLNGTNVNYDATSGSPTLKNKIDSVDTKASTQVDWNEENTSSLAYIKNKPSIPAAQIQSDWTQSDSTKKDFIKNKIPIWISTTAAQDNMSPIDSVTDGNMRPVTSNAVYDAIGGAKIKYADIDFLWSDLTFTQPSGRNFYYCNLNKSNYFANNQTLISATLLLWTSVPMVLVGFDNDTSTLSFRCPDLTMSPNPTAHFKVRYLYIET